MFKLARSRPLVAAIRAAKVCLLTFCPVINANV